MYILNAIVKQLYVLENHKVFIFRIKIILQRRMLSQKRRGIENPSSIFPDFSWSNYLKSISKTQGKEIDVCFISPVGGAIRLSDEGTERISKGVVFITVFMVFITERC